LIFAVLRQRLYNIKEIVYRFLYIITVRDYADFWSSTSLFSWHQSSGSASGQVDNCH